MSGVGSPPPQVVLSPPAIEVERETAKYLDVVKGYWTALGTHPLAGATGTGKTSFMCSFIAEVQRTGMFLGHPAHIPSWLRVIVLDRNAEDWQKWAREAGIECPKGYWLVDDLSISLDSIEEWGEKPKLAHAHFAKVLERLEPEPGGLLITDGALPILGDATISYFRAWANMVRMQRLTAGKYKLTHIPLVHGGKPKTKGSREAKARDTDKANMNAGGQGAADCTSYLTTAQELVGDREDPPPYQIFSWLPHHAIGQQFKLARTESGLFVPYTDEVVELPGPIGRPADLGRVSWVTDMLRAQPGGRMLRKELVTVLEPRIKRPGGYRLITTAIKNGLVGDAGDDVYLIEEEANASAQVEVE